MEDELTGIEEVLCFCMQDDELPTRRSLAVEAIKILAVAFGITVIGFLAAVGLLSLWMTTMLNA